VLPVLRIMSAVSVQQDTATSTMDLNVFFANLLAPPACLMELVPVVNIPFIQFHFQIIRALSAMFQTVLNVTLIIPTIA